MNPSKKRSDKTHASQMAALSNQVKQLREAAAKSGGTAKPSKVKRSNKKAPKVRAAAMDYDNLTAKGSSRNEGYGSKASMPIRESEYIGEVQPSAFPAFSVQAFPVNPGQASCFPWLASIARNFEKYEFDSLAFVYKREVSEFAPNGVTGKVIMYFDSDASDAAPTNKQQMEDSVPHCDCMPSENMRLVIPKSLLKKFNDAKFVRPGAVPANTDIKTYDIGVLYVACQGTAANTVIGELHVEYTLRLRVPYLIGAASSQLISGQFKGTVGQSLANPLGTAPSTTAGSFGASVNGASVVTLALPGTYQITAAATGVGLTGTSITVGSGVVLASVPVSNVISAAATLSSQSYIYTSSVANTTLTFGVTGTSCSQLNVLFAQIVPGSQA